MLIQLRNVFILMLIFTSAIFSGCASYPQNEVQQVGKMPNVSQYASKPSVYIDLKFFQGEPGSSKAVETQRSKEKIQTVIEKTINESLLFSEATFDEFKKNQSDYILKLNIYNHGNAGAAAVSGFLTGFSLFIIPGAATDDFTINAEVIDRNGNIVGKYKNKDSVTTWLGIWFIPVMGNTPDKAVLSTLDNQVKAILKTMFESGKMKYSLLQYNQSQNNS